MTRSNPDEHRTFHVVTEFISVAAIAPFTWHVSKNPALLEWQRWGLKAVAVSAVLVDGWLLLQWMKRPNRRRKSMI